MRTPDQTWQGEDSRHRLLGAKRRLKSNVVFRASRKLILILGAMLVAGIIVPDRIEASDDSAARDASGKYHLAPGDRLAIMVFDQEQLSGEFIVDGAGEVLLPLAGRVTIAGLTAADAQQLIQERFADGVLIQPTVSVRIPEYRPIFVTGDVRNPGSYPFMFGKSVKAAIAAAGGEGRATEQLLSVAISEFITAEERVRQLETNRMALRVRRARLEAQRDGWRDFGMPQLVGFTSGPVDLKQVYLAESDTFSRLFETYRGQLETLQRQQPRIEAEVQAVTDQIAKEERRLEIVSERLADLEQLFGRGLLRKDVLINQRIEEALVQAELSRLAAQLARLRQSMGDLDVRIEEVRANYRRQTLVDLQQTAERLREIEAVLSTARKLRDVRAEYASLPGEEPEYAIRVSRTRGGEKTTFNATNETILEPGDVVEVKLKRKEAGLSLPITEAAGSLIPNASLAESTAPSSR